MKRRPGTPLEPAAGARAVLGILVLVFSAVLFLAGCGREPLAGTDAGNAGKVAGLLYDEAGHPLAAFPVHLRSADFRAGFGDGASSRPPRGWEHSTTTDSRGEFVFRLGAGDTGEAVLEVLDREGAGARLSFRRDDDGPVRLEPVRLRPSGRITGTAGLPAGAIGSTVVTLPGSGFAAFLPDGAGAFDFPALPPGDYLVRVEGVAPLREAVDTLVSVLPGQTVSGIALTAGPAAAESPGAVRLAFAGPGAGTFKARLGPDGEVRTADSGGSLLIAGVAPGTYSLAAWGEGPSRDTVRFTGIQVAAGQAAGPIEIRFKIKALIVDGINNHDWRRMTAYARTLLEETGRFEVAVSTTPPDKADPAQWAAWNPRFLDHDVVLLHYNSGFSDDGKANPWPDSMMRSLEEFVASGRGLVNTHASFPSFAGWPAYAEMIGLVWQSVAPSGPSYMLDARDSLVPVPGSDTMRSYDTSTVGGELVEIANPGHPINQGLPAAWLHPSDKLAYGLKGKPDGITVLSYATSPRTSRREPQQWVKSYGKGRTYTHALGHLSAADTNAAFRCAGFQATLARGTEWAATGQVTLPVPADFPRREAISLRDNLKD